MQDDVAKRIALLPLFLSRRCEDSRRMRDNNFNLSFHYIRLSARKRPCSFDGNAMVLVVLMML